MNPQTKRPLASGKRVTCKTCRGKGRHIGERKTKEETVVILSTWACLRCKGRKKVLTSTQSAR